MKPTFAQEEYALALVRRLRDANLFGADTYGRKVLACIDRLEMSHLIDAMKRELAEYDDEPA